MGFKYIVLILLGILLLFVLIPLLLLLVRRKRSKRKICGMTMQEKVCKLNELAEPFGFMYMPEQDIFISCRDAWQREMGYETLFDRAAVAAHIVIDARPVYFDYEGRTWLIEFWKGQYGMNTGGEVGVYHADILVAPEEYEMTHFEAVEDFEMPYIRCRLTREREIVYEYGDKHWWLTGFRVGMFSKPKDLTLYTAINFPCREMAEAFLTGLQRSGMYCHSYRICGNKVCVDMVRGVKVSWFDRICRVWAQCCNRLSAAAYCIITKPFRDTADRMLFLYYQLPWCFRKMLSANRKRYRRCRRKGNGMS